MRKTIAMFLLVSGICSAQQFRQEFVDTDITHFWDAYDKIVWEKDTSKQLDLLERHYLDKATPGLKSLIIVRRYTAQGYLDAIRNYPKFWQSIRNNTLSAKKHFPEIEADIKNLRKLYPSLKPSPIYFAVGVFRTGGTAYEGKVLIGAEASFADRKTVTDELPDWRKPFYAGNSPVSGLALLCTHEYIHTQQKELVDNLLSRCLYEGVAEFVSCLATGKPSGVPAVAFGKAHEKPVVARYIQDMYKITYDYDWIWGENTNEFKVRDLGYYIGYEICERFYNQSQDKQKAIAELIELDYRDEAAVERIIDRAKLFPKTIAELYADYEAARPTIISIAPFKNGSVDVAPGQTKITVTFSEPLNGENTSVDFGPLGADAFPKLNTERVWSADNRSWTFDADLQPDKKYQILISNNFRKSDGTRLKPYLIEFQTTR